MVEYPRSNDKKKCQLSTEDAYYVFSLITSIYAVSWSLMVKWFVIIIQWKRKTWSFLGINLIFCYYHRFYKTKESYSFFDMTYRAYDILGIELKTLTFQWHFSIYLFPLHENYFYLQVYCVVCSCTDGNYKWKRKRSDSVLWQKPLQQQKNPKSNVTTHKNASKNFDYTTIAEPT